MLKDGLSGADTQRAAADAALEQKHGGPVDAPIFPHLRQQCGGQRDFQQVQHVSPHRFPIRQVGTLPNMAGKSPDHVDVAFDGCSAVIPQLHVFEHALP